MDEFQPLKVLHLEHRPARGVLLHPWVLTKIVVPSGIVQSLESHPRRHQTVERVATALRRLGTLAGRTLSGSLGNNRWPATSLRDFGGRSHHGWCPSGWRLTGSASPLSTSCPDSSFSHLKKLRTVEIERPPGQTRRKKVSRTDRPRPYLGGVAAQHGQL
ncbi:MAG: hypothetical protein QOD35_2915 [Nocardioidaceae bacterium]|nr:hypothetical protein [Nocardioidaceae bacterium]